MPEKDPSTGRFKPRETVVPVRGETPLHPPAPVSTNEEIFQASMEPSDSFDEALVMKDDGYAFHHEERTSLTGGTRGATWIAINFMGFSPDDTMASLRRLWRGGLYADRSDGLPVFVPIAISQTGDPTEIGNAMKDAFIKLETYRACSCTRTVPCNEHVQERMERAV